MVGLSQLAAIVCRIGQDAALLQGDGLQLFIGSGETPLLEVEVAALFNQALQLDGASPSVIALAEIGQGLLDRFAIFLRARHRASAAHPPGRYQASGWGS